MHVFDYSFLESCLLPAGFINITSEISAFKALARLRSDSASKEYEKLEANAVLSSVKSSNAIEGIYTSDERLHAIAAGIAGPMSASEEEILGYKNALIKIRRDCRSMSLDEFTVKELHKLLFGSVAGYDGAGKYKTEDNLIVKSREGSQSIAFVPASAEDTKEAVQQLILAYVKARDNAGINRLLLIPCVILDFLCIHPFEDGNGRVSRLLSLLLLYKNGHEFIKYVSFEEIIDKTRDKYYRSLQSSSKDWHSSKNDYIPFIEYFLMTLLMSYRALDIRLGGLASGRKPNKASRIENLIDNQTAPVSKAEICSLLPDISPTTVESVLGKLVKNGKVLKLGLGKNTRYIK